MPGYASLREDSADAVATIVGRFDPGAPRGAMVQQVGELCLHLHIIAVATLLVDASPQMFFLNLCRAAENWRRLHAHCRVRDWPPPPSSRNGPLLGVIAAGDWELAATLAGAIASEWRREEEYEAEFTYAQILRAAALAAEPRPAALEQLLTTLEATGGDLYSDRIAVARSWAQGHADEFAESFTVLLRAHELETEKKARAFTTTVREFAPHRHIWFEGLAWLRLADRAGIAPSDELLYCPPLARVPMTQRYEGDWVVPVGA